MDHQEALGALVCVQVLPPSLEMKTKPLSTVAASCVPSAEEAMEFQSLMGALVSVHVPPLFVEM